MPLPKTANHSLFGDMDNHKEFNKYQDDTCSRVAQLTFEVFQGSLEQLEELITRIEQGYSLHHVKHTDDETKREGIKCFKLQLRKGYEHCGPKILFKKDGNIFSVKCQGEWIEIGNHSLLLDSLNQIDISE